MKIRICKNLTLFSAESCSSYTYGANDDTSMFAESTASFSSTPTMLDQKFEGCRHRREVTWDGDSSVFSSDFATLSFTENVSLNKQSRPRAYLCFKCQRRSKQELIHTYQPLFDWVDPSGYFFSVDDKNTARRQQLAMSPDNKLGSSQLECKDTMPALVIMLFLREDVMIGSERLDMANTIFEKRPWKFHHAESISRGKIHVYPYNNQNYFIAAPGDPLCAIRQIHCGKQSVRFLIHTASNTWSDQTHLYSLILGQRPKVEKPDFCLFVVSSFHEYDIQVALKMLPPGSVPSRVQRATLCLSIGQVGDLVPLLPHMCIPIADNTWVTRDFDGNVINLKTENNSRDSDSGICSGWPDWTEAGPSKHRKRSRRDRRKKERESQNSDSSSVITDLDAFVQSVLEPLMQSRTNTPAPVHRMESRNWSKMAKTVRFNRTTIHEDNDETDSDAESVLWNSDCGHSLHDFVPSRLQPGVRKRHELHRVNSSPSVVSNAQNDPNSATVNKSARCISGFFVWPRHLSSFSSFSGSLWRFHSFPIRNEAIGTDMEFRTAFLLSIQRALNTPDVPKMNAEKSACLFVGVLFIKESKDKKVKKKPTRTRKTK